MFPLNRRRVALLESITCREAIDAVAAMNPLGICRNSGQQLNVFSTPEEGFQLEAMEAEEALSSVAGRILNESPNGELDELLFSRPENDRRTRFLKRQLAMIQREINVQCEQIRRSNYHIMQCFPDNPNAGVWISNHVYELYSVMTDRILSGVGMPEVLRVFESVLHRGYLPVDFATNDEIITVYTF